VRTLGRGRIGDEVQGSQSQEMRVGDNMRKGVRCRRALGTEESAREMRRGGEQSQPGQLEAQWEDA
jgi:hypothetical protein